MKNERMINCIGIILTGMILDIVGFAISVLAYKNISDTSFSLLFSGLILAGCVISLISIIHNRPSVGLMFKRCFIMLCSFFFFFVANGYLGTKRCLYNILNINANSSSDNVSGMLIATYILVLVFVCMSTIFVKAVRSKTIRGQLAKRQRDTKWTNQKTGDGSLSSDKSNT